MRVQVPIVKPQPWVLPVTVVCLALGILIALTLKQNTSEGTPLESGISPVDKIRSLQHENDDLKKQNDVLSKKYNRILDSINSQDILRKTLQQDIDDLRIRACQTKVEGPGIIITLDDTNTMKANPPDLTPNINPNALIIHDIDLMMLVNELRESGAEAVAINDQRMAGGTAIRCVGPVIHINDRPVSTPFIIQAIGKSDTLFGAMNLPLGVLDQMRPLGIHINVEKKDKLTVPAIVRLPSLVVGKVVKNDTKDTENKR